MTVEQLKNEAEALSFEEQGQLLLHLARARPQRELAHQRELRLMKMVAFFKRR